MRGLICDDHPLMREALTAAMRERWPILTLEEAGDYPTALALAEGQLDLCIADLGMPGAEPLEGVRALRALAPDAVLIVVTGLTDAVLLNAVRGLGPAAILSKNTEARDFLDTVEALTPGLQGLRASRLPLRQQEVLEGLAEGLTNKEIARRLGIPPPTAKIHVARIVTRLAPANPTDAVARAQRARMI